MNASERIKIYIKGFEELRLKAYKCPAGKWTIGLGHTKDVMPGMTITLEKAIDLFENEDIRFCEYIIDKYVSVDLNQNQYDALVSLIFNIGLGNFSTSTLRRKLNLGDYEGAAREFKRWNKAKNKSGVLVELPGLTRRREKEFSIFNSPPEINFRISSNDRIAMKELQMVPYSNSLFT